MSFLLSMFRRVDASSISDEQLYDAQIKHVEHAAAAEHHAALAKMYAERIARLKGNIPPEEIKEVAVVEQPASVIEPPVQERVSWGFRNLNKALQGGFRRGELPVFVAQAKRSRA